jgi:hypothetical protein
MSKPARFRLGGWTESPGVAHPPGDPGTNTSPNPRPL